MQPGGVLPQKRPHQRPPTVNGVREVEGCFRVERAHRPIEQFGRNLEVLGPPVGVVQFLRRGQYQCCAQWTDVIAPPVLVGREEFVPLPVHLSIVLAHHRAHHAVPVAEVILERHGVAGSRGPADLPQADPVDAVGREQRLGRGD